MKNTNNNNIDDLSSTNATSVTTPLLRSGIALLYSSLTSSEENEPAPEDAFQKDAGPGAGNGCLGLLCVTASAFLFGLVAALVKIIAMNVYVMLQVRGTIQLLLSVVAVCAFSPGPRACDAAKFFGEPRRRPILFLRGILFWTYVLLFWSALAGLPVGDATAVVYCAPLFTSLFGWLLLGERVPPHVSGCLTLCMVGIGLITQPTFLFGHGTEPFDADASARYNRGMLFACGSAAVGGLLPVLVRKSKECHWATVELVSALCSSVILTPVALVVTDLRSSPAAESNPGLWDGIEDPGKLLMLGLVALVGFAGLGLQTYGYQRESASRASVMNFLEIPFSYVLQYLMFGDLIAPAQGLGMVLVISSGLINGSFRLRETGSAAGQASNCKQLGVEHLWAGLSDCETPQII